MELKWNKFVQEDKNSYPKNDGDYMVFGVQSCRNFNGENFAGHFNIDSQSFIVLYWAEVPDPEEFKKDFPFQ